MPSRRNMRRSGRGAPRRSRNNNRRGYSRNSGRNDPPSYSEAGFKPLVISFNNTVSKSGSPNLGTWQSITEASIKSGIDSTMLISEPSYEFRMLSAEIWAEAYTMSNTGSDIANLTGVTTELRAEFNSLLGVPTSSATAAKEENRLKVMVDSGTRVRPMHVRYRWPRAHQQQSFLATTDTFTNLFFYDVYDNSDTGPWTSGDQQFYWKYMVRCIILWRAGKQDTPTRSLTVVTANRAGHAGRTTAATCLPSLAGLEQKEKDGSEGTDFDQLVSRWERLSLSTGDLNKLDGGGAGRNLSPVPRGLATSRN